MTNDLLGLGPYTHPNSPPPPTFSTILFISVCACKRAGNMPQICHICLLTAGRSSTTSTSNFPQRVAQRLRKREREREPGVSQEEATFQLLFCFSGGISGGDFSKLSSADNTHTHTRKRERETRCVHVANCQPKTMPIAQQERHQGGVRMFQHTQATINQLIPSSKSTICVVKRLFPTKSS